MTPSPRQRWARRLKGSLARPVITRYVFSPLRAIGARLPQHLLRRLPVVGVFTVPVPGASAGIRLYSDGEDAISNLIFWMGVDGWEPETVKALALIAPRCSTFLDVGANIGYHALVVARVSSHTTVHAFEPVPSVFGRLTRNVDLNALDNIVLHERGLSDVHGRVTIHIPRQTSVLPLQASLLPYPGYEGIEEQDVDVTTVDSFVEERRIPRVDLMKIDVERAEHLVIAGAESTLRRDRPLIVCEVLPDQPSVAQVDETLRRHGYDFFSLTTSRLEQMSALHAHPDGKVVNYLCAHPDRLKELFPQAENMVSAPRIDGAGSRSRRRRIDGAASSTLTSRRDPSGGTPSP